MENDGVLGILLHYLKEKSGVIVMYVLMAMTFYIVCSLNQLKNGAEIFYAVIITAFIGTFYLSCNFYRYYRKVLLLQQMQINLEESIRMLPNQQGLIEDEYQQVVKNLHSKWFKLRDKISLRESEISDYYMMWAHQIKTPIAGMKLLLQEEKDFKLMEELFKIEQYVEMVLHYLRLESITSDMVLKTCDLQGLVKQVLKKDAVLFINSKIQLELGEFECRVLTDEKWLFFMIDQILSNAVKYTRQGMVSIYMQKEASKVLVIEDTGIGIRQEDLPRIFERGFTGYNGRMDQKSTGIGLYLCKQIAHRLGHRITVLSTVESGTRVLLALDRETYEND